MPSRQKKHSDHSKASRKNEAVEAAVEGDETAVKEDDGKEVVAQVAKQTAERTLGGDTGSDSRRDDGERRTKTLVITGSAGGWVEVWEAEGLVAAAGVDK